MVSVVFLVYAAQHPRGIRLALLIALQERTPRMACWREDIG